MWMGIFALIAFAIVGSAAWFFATMTAATNRQANHPAEPREPGEIRYGRTRLGTWTVTVVQADGNPRLLYAIDEEEAHRKGEQLLAQVVADT